ncbi:hypothetical protein SUDANB91_00060 [Streptomyces sp. SudanB91_2054]
MRALPLHLADQRAGRTCRDAYPEAFRLSPEDMANAAEVPTVPPAPAHHRHHRHPRSTELTGG